MFLFLSNVLFHGVFVASRPLVFSKFLFSGVVQQLRFFVIFVTKF